MRLGNYHVSVAKEGAYMMLPTGICTRSGCCLFSCHSFLNYWVQHGSLTLATTYLCLDYFRSANLFSSSLVSGGLYFTTLVFHRQCNRLSPISASSSQVLTNKNSCFKVTASLLGACLSKLSNKYPMPLSLMIADALRYSSKVFV